MTETKTTHRSETRKKTVLIVEDDDVVAAWLKKTLTDMGYAAAGRASGAVKAVAEAKRLAPDIVVMDIVLAGAGDGVQAGAEIRKALGVPVVFISGHDDEDVLERAAAAEPYGFISKPLNRANVRLTLEIALRKRAEEELAKSEERFANLFYASPQAAALSTLEGGRFLEVNEAFAAACGYEQRSQLVGKDSLELGLWADTRQRDRMVRLAKEHGRVMGIESSIRRRDGSVWQGLFSVAVVEVDGSPRLLSMAVDITDRKRLEEERRRAKDAAEAALRAKTRFLCKVSHEIRTPMQAISGLAEMLGDTQLDAGQLELLAGLRRAGDVLTGIVGDIVDYAAVEPGAVSAARRPFSPARLLEETAEGLDGGTGRQGLRVSAVCGAAVPRRVAGDPEKIAQALEKMGEYALTETTEGVTLLAGKDGGGASDMLRFDVEYVCERARSNGTDGMFMAFSEAVETGEALEGRALGLGVAARLAEALGGVLKSSRGPGATHRVFFSIPLPEATDAAEEKTFSAPKPSDEREGPDAAQAQNIRRLRVLAADDNPANISIVKLFLSGLPVDVAVAENGAVAVEMALREAYDIILMDIDMPVMDGRAATKAIRAGERGRRTPIIALTAYALPELRVKMNRAGCDGWLAKPVRRGALVAAMRRAAPWRKSVLGAEAANIPDGIEKTVSETESLDGHGVYAPIQLKPIIPAFLEIQNKNLGKMRHALGQEDFETLRRLGHNMKGAALTYGFDLMAELGAHVERMAKDGAGAAVAADLEDLTEHIEKVHVVYIQSSKHGA